jgi:hypothetical protein
MALFSVSEYELKEESRDVEAEPETAGEDPILEKLVQRQYIVCHIVTEASMVFILCS